MTVRERVTEKAEDVVREAGLGLFGRSKNMVKGFFGGMFSGALTWGLGLFALQATGLATPIANALGGEELVNTLKQLGTNDQGVENVGRRLVASLGMGAAMGAASGATGGMLSDKDGQKGIVGNVVGIGMALVAAAVVVKAAKDGKYPILDHRDLDTPPGPRASRPDLAPRHNA